MMKCHQYKLLCVRHLMCSVFVLLPPAKWLMENTSQFYITYNTILCKSGFDQFLKAFKYLICGTGTWTTKLINQNCQCGKNTSVVSLILELQLPQSLYQITISWLNWVPTTKKFAKIPKWSSYIATSTVQIASEIGKVYQSVINSVRLERCS